MGIPWYPSGDGVAERFWLHPKEGARDHWSVLGWNRNNRPWSCKKEIEVDCGRDHPVEVPRLKASACRGNVPIKILRSQRMKIKAFEDVWSREKDLKLNKTIPPRFAGNYPLIICSPPYIFAAIHCNLDIFSLCLSWPRKDSDEKKWKRAACGLDTQKSAARLAQAAVMMAFAVKDCSVSWTWQRFFTCAKDR